MFMVLIFIGVSLIAKQLKVARAKTFLTSANKQYLTRRLYEREESKLD